jgi:uncharacterized Zn-binding protein involved in type VI secretion
MPGVSRVGVDSAGGTIVGPGIPSVVVNGAPVSVIGDAVAAHGLFAHAAPTMVGGSGTVIAGGIGVVRAGDPASCGDTATGSSDVIAG